MKLQNKKGFTLIELLVVITIIGILATGATAVYTSQIQKARDTNRIKDLKTIESAVSQSYSDKSEYPLTTLASLSGALAPYLNSVPGDPKLGKICYANQSCAYTYKSGGDKNRMANGGYVLSLAFESQAKYQNEAQQAFDKGVNNNRFEIGNCVDGGCLPPTGAAWYAAATMNPTAALPVAQQGKPYASSATAGAYIIINGQ